MATRFYFHDAWHAVQSDMPQTNQHNLTPTSGKVHDAFTTTRTMDFSAGSSAVDGLVTSNASTSQQTLYFHRFASIPLELAVSGIAANTWTYAFSARESNLAANFPVTGTNKTVPINCYVWRPWTQTKIASILQGDSNANFSEPGAATSYRTMYGTFAGSAVSNSSLADGDVIIMEAWFQITQGGATARTLNFTFDGPTAISAANVVNTTPASFIETPQNIVEYVPPVIIQMTNAWTKSLNSKLITTV